MNIPKGRYINQSISLLRTNYTKIETGGTEMFKRKIDTFHLNETVFENEGQAAAFIRECSSVDTPYEIKGKRAVRTCPSLVTSDGVIAFEGMTVYDEYNNPYLVERVYNRGSKEKPMYAADVVDVEDAERRWCSVYGFYSRKSILRPIKMFARRPIVSTVLYALTMAPIAVVGDCINAFGSVSLPSILCLILMLLSPPAFANWWKSLIDEKSHICF